jgi:hypothetical protein
MLKQHSAWLSQEACANIDYEEDLFSAPELAELEEPDEAEEEFEKDDGEDSGE